MKSFLCISVALGVIAFAAALKCNQCDFRAVSICFGKSSSVECTGSCFTTKAYLGSLHLFSKLGCEANCADSKNQTDNIFNFQYDKTCCTTPELCNSGNSVKISLSLGLGMALVWLLNAL